MSTLQQSPVNHIVYFPLFNRSHIRPTLAFILTILELHPSVIVTTVLSSFQSENFGSEIELHGASRLKDLRFDERFRILTVSLSELNPNEAHRIENVAFGKELMSSGLLERLWTGKEGEGQWTKKPCFVLSDIFRTTVRKDLHALNDKHGQARTPVWRMVAAFAFAFPWAALPEELGGRTQNAHVRYKQAIAEGLNERDAAIKAIRFASGKVIRQPGLPPMYDYELTPQCGSREMNEGTCLVWALIYTTFYDSDGLIDIGVPELDEESREYVRKNTGMASIGVGFQHSEKAWEDDAPAVEGKANKDEDDRVLGFLDDAQAKYGDRSVIYISFGSMFWPDRRPEIFEAVIDSLLALDPPAPFVFAAAGAKGKITAEYTEKIEKSGRGIISPWVPQVKLLKHPATAAMMSHAGCGAVTEAILTGVPLIFMPFAADQPPHAMYFSKIRPIGILLYQLASGCDGEPRYDGPTIHSTPETMREELTAAFNDVRGPKGDELRREIKEVKRIISDSKANGGAHKAIMELDRFFIET